MDAVDVRLELLELPLVDHEVRPVCRLARRHALVGRQHLQPGTQHLGRDKGVRRHPDEVSVRCRGEALDEVAVGVELVVVLELNLQRLTQLLRECLVGIPVLRGEGHAKQSARQAGLGISPGCWQISPAPIASAVTTGRRRRVMNSLL